MLAYCFDYWGGRVPLAGLIYFLLISGVSITVVDLNARHHMPQFTIPGYFSLTSRTCLFLASNMLDLAQSIIASAFYQEVISLLCLLTLYCGPYLVFSQLAFCDLVPSGHFFFYLPFLTRMQWSFCLSLLPLLHPIQRHF